MKRIFLFFSICILSVISVSAQEITVKSMTELPMDLSARIDSRKDNNEEPCALIKVQLTVEDAVFEGNVVGDVERHVNEYWVYMTAGSKMLYVKHPKLLTLAVTFSDYEINSLDGFLTYQLVLSATLPVVQEAQPITGDIPALSDSINQATNYNVQPNLSQPTQNVVATSPSREKSYQVYIEGRFQPINMMGVGGGIGAYIKNFNIEAYAIMGMSESDEVFWIPSDKRKTPYSYTYKATQFGAKLGYAYTVAKRFRFTPQIGACLASISGTEKQRGTGTDPKATEAYAIPVSAGLRAEVLFGSHFGLSLSPEYSFAVVKSDVFTRICDAGSDAEKFGQGFNARVGLFVCF